MSARAISPSPNPLADNPLAEKGNFAKWVACARKRPYGSRKIAMGHAAHARKKYGSKLGAYQCQHCGLWHLFTERDSGTP